jgi:poly-gamma-glutamate system protein
MKKIYWHPHYLARSILVLICVFALAGLSAVEYFKKSVPENFYNEKLAAATLAYQAMQAIKAYRIEKKIPIDREVDPQNSGLIGEAVTITTSDQGNLLAKQTSINPNIAAQVIEWFKAAGLQAGDTVAIGLTGSLPALNIAVLSAVKALGLKPLIITSAASSQWGANIPGLAWLDMQDVLIKQNILPYMPIASSLGGIDDRARGMSKEGKEELTTLIQRMGIPFIDSKNARDGVKQRMALFQIAAQGRPIKAYVNVGGGTASVGAIRKLRKSLNDGIHKNLSISMAEVDSVMVRFLKKGVPIVNLTSMNKIAYYYDFPIAPATLPRIGQGKPFFRAQYNIYLAFGQLIAITILLTLISVMSRKNFSKKHQPEMNTL